MKISNDKSGIKYISSRSYAGILLNGEKLKLGDEVVTVRLKPENKYGHITETKILKDSIKTSPVEFEKPKSDANLINKSRLSSFRGRISVQSSTNFSNYSSNGNDQRWRYSFSSDANNIDGSDFSFTSYLNFFYRTSEWNRIKNNLGQNLRLYDLAVKYDFDNSMSALIGRHINLKISSIGSIDGLQFQKSWEHFYSGAIIGSRPNITDFGLNTKLFEVGGYVGYSDTLNDGIMENTLAFFEQTNNFKTDRRFLYFQHNSSLFPDFNLFVSSEIDIYKKENGESKNSFSLTSFYLNSRYAPFRWMSFSVSYDTRKNIIYYETYKNLADNLFNRETRQGLRFSINLRPINNIFLGLNAGYTFERKDLHPSRNFGGFINYSGIPLIESTISLTITKLITSYLDGNNYGVIIYKDLFDGLVNVSGGYRRIDYKYQLIDLKFKQDIFSLDISIRIIKNLFLSSSYESTIENKRTINRLMVDLTTRF